MTLLERSGPRGELRAAVDALAAGRGRVVLVHGEAGIGKTSLVQDFLDSLPSSLRTLSGGCDDLLAPRPLGAVLELLDGVRGHVLDAAGHPGRQAYEALGGEPTVCVVEDVHWADEATLDVLSYLARRIVQTPLLLLLTFRDDELPAGHPLRRTLAAAPPSHSRRIGLAPLSLDAVRRLAGPGVDAEAVHRLAGGNPFLVTELLAGDGGDAPASVRDAVLGRFGRLLPAGRATAELVSVVPGRTELWLIEDCLGAAADVEACEALGLLVTDRTGVRFRHELARRVIEEALPGQHRRQHNAAVLGALIAASAPDARIAHHAWRAGDAAALVRHGLSAAHAAAASRSHREAADLFEQVLEYEDLIAAPERADAWDAFSTEAFSAGRIAVAVEARERALALRRELGDPRRTSDTLRWLSWVRGTTGDARGAETAGREAIDVLGPLPPCRELAMALSNQAQFAILAQRGDEALGLARRAAEVAESLGDTEALVEARVNVGTASALVAAGPADIDAAVALLLRMARTARELGDDHTECRALVNATWILVSEHRLVEADRLADEAMALAQDRGLWVYVDYLHASRALLALAMGDLSGAETELAYAGCGHSRRAPGTELTPESDTHHLMRLIVRASIAVRRGDGDAAALLDEGWALAIPTARCCSGCRWPVFEPSGPGCGAMPTAWTPRPGRPMRTRSSGARRGTSACWRSGAGERACWTRHRRDCPRRAGSNSTIGRPRPPPCGEAWASRTGRRSRCWARSTRRICGRRSRSSIASARWPPCRWPGPGCAHSASPLCRVAGPAAPGRIRGASPIANSRCSGWWRPGCPTGRSRDVWCCRPRRWSTMSARCSPSWASARGPRPPPPRVASAWWDDGRGLPAPRCRGEGGTPGSTPPIPGTAAPS